MKRSLLAGSLALILMLSMSCKGRVTPEHRDVTRPALTGVVPVDVTLSTVDSYYETSGTLRAKTTSEIAGRIMGTVTAVYVKEGDRVSAGDPLVQLDDKDGRERVRAAEAGHKEAVKALETAKERMILADVTARRYQALYEEKVISRQEMDQIETAKKVAQGEYGRFEATVTRAAAQLDEARVHQSFSRITAPFAGVVSAKRIEVGAMAVPGAVLLTVEDDAYFKLEAPVDERLFAGIKVGTPVVAVIGATGVRIPARVAEVVPAIDPSTRTFVVRARLNDRSLKSGLYARLLIPEERRKTILIPAKAIVRRGQLEGVFAVDGKGTIAYRFVRTGTPQGGNVEVLSGLKEGERIIVEGVERAMDGAALKQ